MRQITVSIKEPERLNRKESYIDKMERARDKFAVIEQIDGVEKEIFTGYRTECETKAFATIVTHMVEMESRDAEYIVMPYEKDEDYLGDKSVVYNIIEEEAI